MRSENQNYLSYTPDIYSIVDVNGKPFIVMVYDGANKAMVYRNDIKGEDNNSITKIKEIEYENIFIGKSCNKEEDENFNGNSILFEIKKQEYVFVGEIIYYFNTKPNKDKIVKFISNMGRNRFPYPFDLVKKIFTSFWIESFYLMLY